MSVLIKPYTDTKADARIAIHAALATIHQNAPNLIGAHAALTTGIHGAGSDHLALFEQASQLVSKAIWIATDTVLTDSNRSATLDWTDLDLTAETSERAKFAILLLRVSPDTVGTGTYSYLQVRKNGVASAYTPILRLMLEVEQGTYYFECVIVGLDSDQVLEYKISVGTDWQIDSRIDLLGYIE